jgi:hypothetical protein
MNDLAHIVLNQIDLLEKNFASSMISLENCLEVLHYISTNADYKRKYSADEIKEMNVDKTRLQEILNLTRKTHTNLKLLLEALNKKLKIKFYL